MDFSFSDTQRQLYDQVRAFAGTELAELLAAAGAKGTLPREAWRAAGRMGLLGACVPERYGGLGLDHVTTARIYEAFGHGCPDTGFVFSAAAHLFACAMPIAEGGSDELRRELLPSLCDGTRVGANAISEAEAGSDVHALATRARRDGDVYVVDGHKSYVTNGPEADLMLVYAVTNPAHGYLGLSGFAVDARADGCKPGKPFELIGLEGASIGSVYLDGVRVPESRRIGAEGQGAALFAGSMAWERACLFALYVGVMERQLEECIEYAKSRRQGGKRIGSYQAVSHRIVEMKFRLDSARLLLYRACWTADQGQRALLEISLAKLAVSQASIASALDAIRIHGGIGATRALGLEAALRDAVPSEIFSGTSDIQRNIAARELGL